MPDLLELQRQKLGPPLRDDLTCDTCGVPATVVHLLPWCVDTTEVALTGACECRTEHLEEMQEEDELEDEGQAEPPRSPKHLESGYFFDINQWAWKFSHESGESWSMRDQLSEKIRGEQTIAMVDRRLKRL